MWEGVEKDLRGRFVDQRAHRVQKVGYGKQMVRLTHPLRSGIEGERKH